MQNELIKTVLDLVQIDSPSGEEDAVRDYVIQRLKTAGIESLVDKTGNLFARIEGRGEPVVLSCHMDTVEPGRGIEPVVDNGVIRSKGETILGADNKVAVAAILHLLENLPNKHVPLEVVFSVREETDGGINEFDFSQLTAHQGIVADSSTPVGTIITAAPWIKDIFIEIEGKSAHAARPEEGNNALSAAVAALQKLPWGRLNDTTTANIGIIKGGSGTNTIPGRVSLGGEIRSFDLESIANGVSNIKETFEGLERSHGVRVSVNIQDYCDGYVFDDADGAMVRLTRAINEIGVEKQTKVSHGGSDANAFNSHGIKVINIGDGSKAAHTVDESIEVAELEKLYLLMKTYISIQS